MTDTLPAFDPHNPEYFETGLPFDLLAELRQHGPVAKTPLGYYLTRRQEADELLYAVDTYGSDMTPGTGLGGVEEVPQEQLFLPEIDEPVHGQIPPPVQLGAGAPPHHEDPAVRAGDLREAA